MCKRVGLANIYNRIHGGALIKPTLKQCERQTLLLLVIANAALLV